MRKCIFLFNGLVPQTNETVTKAIKGARLNGKLAEVVWTVPYVLKLLCEGGKDGEGVKVLKECKVVSCSGSRTPDELGDLLVEQGIPFGTVFGAYVPLFPFSLVLAYLPFTCTNTPQQ